MVTLTFDSEHDYASDAPNGITVPVTLSVGADSVRLFAKLDTGASSCIFQRDYGEQLGLNIEAGERKTFGTATGPFETFGHEVTVRSFGHEFNSTVYFASAREFTRNVVGRTGWLEKFRIAVIDYDSRLYLSIYDAP